MSDVVKTIDAFSKRELGAIKVLMVEDDKFISSLVLHALSQHGCVPYSCPTGEEALVLAEQFHPDAIILDLMLPGCSGEEVLVKLQESINTKDIPVVVFSNKSEASDIEYVLAHGAKKYLVKASTDVRTIVDIIRAVTHTKNTI